MPAYVYGLASRDWFFERRGPHAGRCRLCLFRCDGCASLATAAFCVLPGRNCGRTRCNNNYHNMLDVDYHSLTKHVQALRLSCKWRFFSELSTTTHGLDLLRALICASQKASFLVDRISILDLIDSALPRSTRRFVSGIVVRLASQTWLRALIRQSSRLPLFNLHSSRGTRDLYFSSSLLLSCTVHCVQHPFSYRLLDY